MSSLLPLTGSQNNTIEDATRTIFETEEVGRPSSPLVIPRSGNHERAAETERCLDECFGQGEGYDLPVHAGKRGAERTFSIGQLRLENEQEILAEKVIMFVGRNA